MSTFQDFLRRLMYNCIDDDGDQPLLDIWNCIYEDVDVVCWQKMFMQNADTKFVTGTQQYQKRKMIEKI